ncbi:ATP-binding cassette domain-containing protein [Roseovarius salis]|uniref:ATP-binding cassette domain-containing protein n=1 Tax=Roseovarius salis TaxID=3376063 RepID=UPI0037C5DC6D
MSDAAAIPVAAMPERTARAILPLRVRELCLQFGEATVLDGLDLDLGPDGCTAVVGPNGAGKSLLLKLLHGLIPPTWGRISWGGQPPGAVTARQSLVFQKPVLLRRTVAANLDFVLRARNMDRRRGGEILREVGLADKASQPARRLSGGEAQRLALARALATQPEVLFLDEPTASLDPASALAIEKIVTQACRRGVRVILVTHDIGQARRLADDVVFLYRGRVAEHAAAADFFPVPRCRAARDYLNGRLVL